MAQHRPARILVVEDNPGDARLITESFGEIRTPADVRVLNNGDRTLEHLRDAAEIEEPIDLVLLDLNLPGRSGRDILSDIKGDVEMRATPTFILSSSKAERDINDCYRRHANAYLTKPDDFEDFVRLAKAIEAFWMDCVTPMVRPGAPLKSAGPANA